jgi:flotillin
MGTVFIIAFLIVIAVLAVVGVYASRYQLVPPDKAMVVYGRKKEKKGFKVLSGGGAFIYPVIEAYAYLPLDVRTLEITVADIVTDVKTSGAKLNIKSVTQVKIASDTASLLTAAEQLLHKSDPEINMIAIKTLEGHVRGICATMTIEAINSDRDMVSEKVQTQAARDLRNMGIEIRSFVISELEDEKGYLDALGRKRTAEVKRDARIGEADANKEATIREAMAAQDGEKANAQAEAQVALFHRDRDITRAKAETEVEVERANRNIAFDLQDRKRKQELIQEEIQIQIEERKKQIDLQEKEIARRTKEQEAEKVVPAKAEAEAKVAQADGEKERIIRLSQAQREQLKLTAEGQAEKIMKEGTAEADIIRLKGEAEADAIKAKGLAEAKAMEQKALAWKQYGSAAITQLIVEQLPEIVASASKPLEGVEKVIVMGDQGPAGLVQKTVDISAQMPALVKALTGMDITDLVGQVGALTGGGFDMEDSKGIIPMAKKAKAPQTKK